jgi:prepilin-type N-terminal cleavage/methylation domain-containing protein
MPTQKHGFTLVEMLVVTSVFIIASLVTAQILISTVALNSKVRINQTVKQAGDVAVDSMTRLIQNAYTITATCTKNGASNNGLILTEKLQDGTTGTILLGCVPDGAYSRVVTSLGTDVSALTPSLVTLINQSSGTSCGSSLADAPIIFRCIGEPSSPKKISIQFSLAGRGMTTGIIAGTKLDFASDVNIRNTTQ